MDAVSWNTVQVCISLQLILVLHFFYCPSVGSLDRNSLESLHTKKSSSQLSPGTGVFPWTIFFLQV